jgi:competence protein ComEC
MAAPLFPITLALCLGIILSKVVVCSTVPLLLTSSFLVLASWTLFWMKNTRLLIGVLLLAFLSMGVAWPSIHKASYGPDHLSNLVRTGKIDLSQPCRIAGICSKNSVQRGIGEQIELDVDRIDNRYSVRPTRGKVRLALYYKKEAPTHGISGRSRDVAAADRPSVTSLADSPPPSPIMHAGDRVEVFANLRQPKNFNNPGQFDYVSYLERQGVFLVGIVKNELLVTRIATHQGSRLMSFIQELRANLENALNRSSLFSDPVRAALKALLLGEKQGLDPNLEKAFQASGIYHVLVVSGQHVAILSGFLLGLFTLLRFPRGVSILLTMSALILYCLITESQPSIVRATLMTCAFLVVLTFDRDRNLLNSLSAAALLLLLTDPSWLFDPGFQLSFLAVLAIGLIGLPLLRRTTQPYRNALWQIEEPSLDGQFAPAMADLRLALRLRIESLRDRLNLKSSRLSRWILLWPLHGLLSLADVLLISISVQAIFFVLMILYFHRVSLVSIFLNALVVPLVSLIVPLGFLFLILSFVAPWVSAPLGALCGGLTQWLLTLAEYFAHPAWGNYRIPTPPDWLVVVYLLCLLLLLLPSAKMAIRLCAAALALLAMTLLLTQPFGPSATRDQLQMTLLDVRQGDSIFLQFPDGTNMLIDGGGLLGRSFGEDFSEEAFDVGEQVVSPFLWSKGQRNLDVVVLTHAHHDHMGGLDAILNDFQVQELWLGENPYTPEYVRLLKQAIRKGIALRHFGAGDMLPFHGSEIVFINPVKGLNLSHPASNNDSLAFQLKFGARTLLLTGDIERKIEAQIMNRTNSLHSDLLKVAHHGSRSSTTDEFLQRVSPILALISVAEHSPFGHPHDEVLKRLEKRSVPIFRKAQDGAIFVRTEGRQLQVDTLLESTRGVSTE